MKKGIKKFLKQALGNKSKLPKKTARLRDLIDKSDKGSVIVKMTKSGEVMPRKSKKDATHVVIETANGGAIAEPIKKHKHKSVNGGYGEPRIATEQAVAAPTASLAETWHPPVPAGASWIQYIAGSTILMMPLKDLESLRGFRGKIVFGRLRYNEDFVNMMPGDEEGNVTRWKDGVTIFAEGKSPAELAKKRASMERVELARQMMKEAGVDGLAPHVAQAFKAKSEARRVPPGPRPGDVAGKIQNGVRKPGAGGKTARVWEICDELLKSLGRAPTKTEVLAVSVGKEKASPGMSGTQFSYWRRFYGHNQTN